MKKYGLSWMLLAIVVALLALPALVPVFATALTADRDTPARSGEAVSLTVKNDEVIYQGSLVSVDSNGEAVSATDTASDVVVGRAASYVNNADDGETIVVERGIFRWENGGSLTDAHIGDLCYVEDDQTVTTAAEASNDIVAGIIIDVDSDGVWVDSYAIGGQGAASVTTLDASGAASLGSTLAVTGAATLGSTLEVTGASTLTGAASLGSTLAVTGASTLTGGATIGTSLTASYAAQAAPTNAATAGLAVTVNGTNYWIGLSLPND